MILIPRVNLIFSETVLPFQFHRTEFPVISTFAMTMNKSQVHNFAKVSVLLRCPAFSHTGTIKRW